MSRVCPLCGESMKAGKRYCAICTDDTLRARRWQPADIERLVKAARAMTDAFRLHTDHASAEDCAAWVNLIDAIDRRQTGPAAFDDEGAA